MNTDAYDDLYNEYIDNILSISALSDKDHFIFYSFNIKDNICFDEVYMLNQKGEKGEFGKKNFNYNEEFYEKFIKNLVKKFYKANSINSKDIVYDKNDNGTFRMITDNKDIFTISGLSKENNEALLDMLKNKSHEENKQYVLTDNKGKVNYLMLVFIVVLIIAIIGLVLFL